MLNRIKDRRVAQAFISLDQNYEWEVIKSWLENEIKEMMNRLILEEDENQIHRYQGGLRGLGDLLNKPDQARHFLNKIK